MTRSVRAILLGVVLGTLAIAIIWKAISQFDVAPGGFLVALTLLPAPLALGLFYTYFRPDERLAAMLLGFCFLIVYAPVASVLTYFQLSVAGARIDQQLAAIDRAMGFDWPAMMIWASNHPIATKALLYAYVGSFWESVALVFFLGWRTDPSDISKFCLSLVVCAYLTTTIWMVWPSFGAISVYNLPPSVAAKLHVIVNPDYARSLVEIYRNGPGKIAADNMKGLVGFPSYHTVFAVTAIWFTRKNRALRWPFLAFNIVAIISTPIQGGHHVIDTIGGIVVSTIGIAISSWAINAALARDAKMLLPKEELEHLHDLGRNGRQL